MPPPPGRPLPTELTREEVEDEDEDEDPIGRPWCASDAIFKLSVFLIVIDLLPS
jgi:hypothetical protein